MEKYIPKRREDLFRREAVESLETVWSGKVLLIRPITFTVYSIFSLAVIAGLVFFVCWGWYTKKETAIGYIRPMDGITGITIPASGIISKYHVEEGQHVKAGDLLVTVKTEIDNIDGAIGLQVEHQLNQQLLYTLKNSENSLAMISIDKKEYEAQINNNKKTLISLREKNKLLEDNQEYLEQEFSATKVLFDRGLISKTDIALKTREVNLGRISLAEVSDDIRYIENEIQMLEFKVRNIGLEEDRNKINLELLEAQLEQRLVELSKNNEYVIRAPIDGVVSAIVVTEANTVLVGKKILSILPENNTWMAELFVPTRGVAHIGEGSEVNIKYEAFPYQKYGLYKGTVTTVSRTVLSPADVPDHIRIAEPVYRIFVELSEQAVSLQGKEYQLQAGMPLSAEIESETRKLYQWMLGPLVDIKRKVGGGHE